MMLRCRRGGLILVACMLSLGALAAPPKLPPAKAEVKLEYGITELKLGSDAFRIVRAFVSDGTASSFDTFTVFMLPKKAGEPWLQVAMPGNLGLNLRNVESGDSNVQSIAFYKLDNHLYAVQARRDAWSGEQSLNKIGVDIKVFKFNEMVDFPMFEKDATMHSKAQFMDARDALTREFFRP